MNAKHETPNDWNAFPQAPPALNADNEAGSPVRLWYFDIANPEGVAELAAQWSGQIIYRPFHPLYFANRDRTRAALVVLHKETTHDAEMIACASPGICWTRPAVRGIARWAFVQLAFRRLTAKVRSSDPAAIGYMQRLGFRFEGRQVKYFADDVDASLWGMTVDECPWLTRGL